MCQLVIWMSLMVLLAWCYWGRSYVYIFDLVQGVHPKTSIRLPWFFRRPEALFRQIRTFPQLFRFFLRFGNSGIRNFRIGYVRCRSFYHDLHQTQLSGCSAFPESRLQSVHHPYSPLLRANTFLRIIRNRVQESKPHPKTLFEIWLNA